MIWSLKKTCNKPPSERSFVSLLEILKFWFSPQNPPKQDRLRETATSQYSKKNRKKAEKLNSISYMTTSYWSCNCNEEELELCKFVTKEKYNLKSVTERRSVGAATILHSHPIISFLGGVGVKDTSIKTAYRDSIYKHISQVTGQVIKKGRSSKKKCFLSAWEVKSLRLMLKSRPDHRASKIWRHV